MQMRAIQTTHKPYLTMKKQYEVICLDNGNKPKPVATITENSQTKAIEAGKRLAIALNLRFHTAKLIKT